MKKHSPAVIGVAAAVRPMSAAEALLELSSDVVRIAGDGFADVFRRDCADLVRRISLLTDLFKEMREFTKPVDPSPSNSVFFVADLIVALQAAKRFLLVAADFDSTVSSDNIAKKISFQLQCVTWKLDKALGNLPLDHFGISEEVQEQVEFVRAQLRRATERYGPMNSKLVSYTLSLPLAKETGIIERRNGVAGTDREKVHDIPVRNDPKVCLASRMLQERMRNSSSSSDVCLPNKIDAEKLTNEDGEEKKNSESVVIPVDFLCPISLELMRDPVIVSTGQTYERSYIQRWIDCGNNTCPKTQQQLQNLTLTPNYVLRSLITQWCVDNNVEQPTGFANRRIKKSDGSHRVINGDTTVIETLIRKLSSQMIDEQRSAVSEIRSLSKRSTDNRILIGGAGAIPALVNLLTVEDIATQENAVTSILNLSIYENNKGLIMLAGAIPSIVQVLRTGSMEARENSAATLFSLSLADENKIVIGASEAIPALVDLLQTGSSRGKKDAATALFNLCIYQGNKGRAVRAGIVGALYKMLTDESNGMVDEALTILSVLAGHPDAKAAVVKASTIPVLIDLMRMGLARNKENAAAILLSLCKRDTENLACISRLGAFIPLTELAKSGTDRAKRKATSLLEHLRKVQQHL